MGCACSAPTDLALHILRCGHWGPLGWDLTLQRSPCWALCHAHGHLRLGGGVSPSASPWAIAAAAAEWAQLAEEVRWHIAKMDVCGVCVLSPVVAKPATQNPACLQKVVVLLYLWCIQLSLHVLHENAS